MQRGENLAHDGKLHDSEERGAFGLQIELILLMMLV
jgi:hypothetical protein